MTHDKELRIMKNEQLEHLTGCGKLHVSFNTHEGKLIRINAYYTKCGHCLKNMHDVANRLINLSMRHGASLEEIAKMFKGIECPKKVDCGDQQCLSCWDALHKILEQYIKMNVRPIE